MGSSSSAPKRANMKKQTSLESLLEAAPQQVEDVIQLAERLVRVAGREPFDQDLLDDWLDELAVAVHDLDLAKTRMLLMNNRIDRIHNHNKGEKECPDTEQLKAESLSTSRRPT